MVLELLNGWEIIFEDTKKVYYLDKENGLIEEPQFPMLIENEWKGEEALDSKYYGNIVYGLSENLTGKWRLFYRNSSYVYIILDEPIGNYNPSDYYTSYKNGLCVSTTGKNLNLMVSNLFVESNEDENIKATAWLTDTSNELWKAYAYSSGVDGAIAIGSPTIELMAASYNATQSSNAITLTVGEQGYKENTGNNWLVPGLCGGIYSYNTSCMYWIGSPFFETNRGSWLVRGDRGYFDRNYWNSLIPIRPIICLPISNLPVEFGYYKQDD